MVPEAVLVRFRALFPLVVVVVADLLAGAILFALYLLMLLVVEPAAVGLPIGADLVIDVLLPLLGACVPLLLRAMQLRQPLVYSITFFALFVVAEHYKLNALIFGIGYLLCMAQLKQSWVLPIKLEWFMRLQTWLAIPLILTFGIVQINVPTTV